MEVKTKKLPKNEIEIIVDLGREEMTPYINKAVKEISANKKIPGFRPGFADYEVVKKHFGEMVIWQHAAYLAIEGTWQKVLERENLVTVGQPKVDFTKLAPNNPFQYKIIVSLLPTVKIGDLSKVRVKSEKIEILDKELNKALKELQKMRATEKRVDRAAKKGDKVITNIEITLNNVLIENGKLNKFSVIIGEGKMIPGFEEKLIGLKSGDETKFKLKFPKDYHNKNLAQKECDFKVKVQDVYNIELPKLDDKFAKSVVPNIESFVELKDKLKVNLKKEKEYEAEVNNEKKMFDELIKISEFDDIPEVLVNAEAKKMVGELEQNLQRNGIDPDKYLKDLNKKRSDLLLDFAPEAIKRVKVALILRELAKQRNIEVKQDEIEKRINNLKQQYQNNENFIKQTQEAAFKDYIKHSLLNDKILKVLKDELIVAK
jgi:trigger factor